MRILKSLNRGLQVLDYMDAQDKAVRLTDVAMALGVDRSNASHLLRTLVVAGYARQDSKRRYMRTRRSQPPSGSEHSLEEIVACKEAWRPALESVAAATGECAHLAVRVESRVWYIDKVDSTSPLKVDHPVGHLAPLHCTALGKAFLAFGDAEAARPLTSYTSATKTTMESLLREIERTRQRGYAVDNEEFAVGIRCAGAPIKDSDDRMIAALSVSGPTVRIGHFRLQEIGQIILAHTSRNQGEASA